MVVWLCGLVVMTPSCHDGNRSSILLRAAKIIYYFSLRMSSSDKMRKILDKINNYQSKIDDNIEKFNTLVYKHFSNVIDNSNEQLTTPNT